MVKLYLDVIDYFKQTKKIFTNDNNNKNLKKA